MGTATTTSASPSAASEQPAEGGMVPSTRPPAPGGAGPDPEQLARLQQCLQGVLAMQCSIGPGVAAAAFLGGSRPSGLLAQHAAPGSESLVDGGPLLTPPLLERLERVAAAACAAFGSNRSSGVVEAIAIQRSRAMYGDELRLRAVAEHGAPAGYESPLTAARTNLPGRGPLGWLVRLALFPHHVNYHIEHHLYPAVPHYRLAALHRRLDAEGLLQGAEVRPFTDTLRRVFAPRGSVVAAGQREGFAHPEAADTPRPNQEIRT